MNTTHLYKLDALRARKHLLEDGIDMRHLCEDYDETESECYAWIALARIEIAVIDRKLHSLR